MKEIKIVFKVTSDEGEVSFEKWEEITNIELRESLKNKFLQLEQKLMVSAAQHLLKQRYGENRAEDIEVTLDIKHKK